MEEPQSAAAYGQFGLNHRQIELIATATPKRDYYLQSRRGNRLFQLALGPIARSLCGASSPADQARIDGILAEPAIESFVARYLAASGQPWAVELLASFPTPEEAVP